MERRKTMNEFKRVIDSAADIRIYDYKTKTVHTEKAMVLFRKDTLTIACLGNECEAAYEQITDKENYSFVIPISMGKIYDYITSEKLLRWMIGKYIDRADGKRRIFKRSSKALIYLHEPLSPIDLRTYEDLMYLVGYKEVIVISSNTDLGGMTPEEAIWSAEEAHGKLDCAIEITKEEPLGYARYAFEEFKKDCKRWGVDPSKVMGECSDT
jgi:hypothetical protein